MAHMGYPYYFPHYRDEIDIIREVMEIAHISHIISRMLQELYFIMNTLLLFSILTPIHKLFLFKTTLLMMDGVCV
jgi:hemerythrin